MDTHALVLLQQQLHEQEQLSVGICTDAGGRARAMGGPVSPHNSGCERKIEGHSQYCPMNQSEILNNNNNKSRALQHVSFV